MKNKILRIIEIKLQIAELEKNDKEKQEIISSGSYAIAEGYVTRNMRLIQELEDELEKIELA